jgi:hypothetical protein
VFFVSVLRGWSVVGLRRDGVRVLGAGLRDLARKTLFFWEVGVGDVGLFVSCELVGLLCKLEGLWCCCS